MVLRRSALLVPGTNVILGDVAMAGGVDFREMSRHGFVSGLGLLQRQVPVVAGVGMLEPLLPRHMRMMSDRGSGRRRCFREGGKREQQRQQRKGGKTHRVIS